ncbi:hypothetical protein SPRG_13652 [Saprolegnia parasitica CBS 223.65]|uniref:RING-type domain-containing protein n=1 Tax=Saprolegnia parasitica (strain CBS 223.65) TaxID=695850 RepID=A0A067C2R3_SAPPC|nr:hypothetical protein SPRG_13652 [Saprolegnia parasitica CBS 223.65]KDO20836.1 hypothetical protein SPRG_13652 [Saprolegnia parasitica CBS 223.65]|eukprot:XP_012208493.1 hypothetical protein SPRG_13652 [Saprolegnia parasitica CBS 223.65]
MLADRPSPLLPSSSSLSAFPRDQRAYDEATCETAIEIRRSFAFTKYSIQVTCPITQRSWVVEKRCSSFYAFRDTIEAFLLACGNDDVAIRRLATTLLRGSLPTKLVLDKYGASTMRKRSHILKKYLWLALDCRSVCYLYPVAARSAAHGALMTLLDTFLDVPVSLRDIRFQQATNEQMLDTCAICTYEYLRDEFDELGKVVQLPCGHCFHRDCVNEWLYTHNTCPMCRHMTDKITGLHA